MPYRLCEKQLMEQPVKQPCNCDIMLYGEKKRTRFGNFLMIRNCSNVLVSWEK